MYVVDDIVSTYIMYVFTVRLVSINVNLFLFCLIFNRNVSFDFIYSFIGDYIYVYYLVVCYNKFLEDCYTFDDLKYGFVKEMKTYMAEKTNQLP